MIHNPQVNADLKALGVQFLQDTYGRQVIPFEALTGDDVVIIPAFGTTLEIQQLLHAKGIHTEHYDTTCPFVRKVWNRSEQIAEKGYSIVVHGKPKHEETRATFSHASSSTPTVVVNDIKETIALAQYITKQRPTAEFYTEFAGRYSPGFDPEKDLQRIGVVNQTTQLATDTQAISDYLRSVIMEYYGLDETTIHTHFADTRDTLCYATNDNQSAVLGMLEAPADMAIVVGGYNSSNTSHLVELCEQKLPTYFINDAGKLLSKSEIKHCNWRTKEEKTIMNYLPQSEPARILITSGASCPDAVVERVIARLLSFYPIEKTIDEITEEFV
jgi:4-hydroxy-3-methylbut-2-enyl diphosphate reductase